MFYKKARLFFLCFVFLCLVLCDSAWAAEAVANAGKDFVFSGVTGSKIVLDGTQSINVNKYRWQLLEGPKANLQENLYPYKKLPYANTPNPHFRPGKAGIYRFGLWVSGKNGKESYDEVNVDFREPFYIELSTPDKISIGRNERNLYEKISVFTVSGTIAELNGYAGEHIAKVQCVNHTIGRIYNGKIIAGKYGVGKDFIFSQIELEIGDNKLEVIGQDDQGTVARSFCWVTCNAADFILGNSRLDTSMNYRNSENEPVTFSVNLSSSLVMPEKLELYEVDEEGKIIRKVMDLLPDEASDSERIYSGKFASILPDFNTFLYYRAKFVYNEIEYLSSPMTLDVYYLDNSRMKKANSINDEAISHLSHKENSISTGKKEQLVPMQRLEIEEWVEALAEELNSNSEVHSVDIYDFGLRLMIFYKNGARMSMSFTPPDDDDDDHL